MGRKKEKKLTIEHREKIGFARLGKKHSLETRKKMSLAHSGSKNVMWGRKRSKETLMKVSKALSGEKHPFWGKFGKDAPNWKGGLTNSNAQLRNTYEFKQWRISVYKRDNFTCVQCGYKSRGLRPSDINADHILPFSQFPEYRLDINNGRTLCIPCHKETDTYAGKANKVLTS